MVHFELKRGPREDDVDDVEWQAAPLADAESVRLAGRTLKDIKETVPGLFLSLELICLQSQLTSVQQVCHSSPALPSSYDRQKWR